jgi:hypothetical protein
MEKFMGVFAKIKGSGDFQNSMNYFSKGKFIE